MRILHLSDIHFSEPECSTPSMDENRHVRTRLMQDARRRCHDLGGLDAILVGGDVAYKGHPAEYEAAHDWLVELAGQCDCDVERIYVIPGNHDVDRGVIQRSRAIQNAQLAVRQVAPAKRKAELLAQIRDAAAGSALFEPLAAYNAFAARFSCQVNAPDKLFWRQEVPIGAGLRLRINGLTSTLLSGQVGVTEDRNLYLSPLQTAFDPEDDVVHLVLCHHPPDWFLDQDEVDDAFCGRAAIHLFGHKHRQRVHRETSYIRFGAGAVNPDRSEGNWQPGYNIIDITGIGSGADRKVSVEAHVLEWQSNPDGYRPKLTTERDAIWRHTVHTPAWAPITSVKRSPPMTIAPTHDPQGADQSVDEPLKSELAMSAPPTRNLIYRFWKLSVSQRRALAQRFHLLEPGEEGLPEPERYGRALLRARDRRLLDDLGRAIEELEP